MAVRVERVWDDYQAGRLGTVIAELPAHRRPHTDVISAGYRLHHATNYPACPATAAYLSHVIHAHPIC